MIKLQFHGYLLVVICYLLLVFPMTLFNIDTEELYEVGDRNAIKSILKSKPFNLNGN